jgi:hypothetical protein
MKTLRTKKKLTDAYRANGSSIGEFVKRDIADSVDLYFAPFRAAVRQFGKALRTDAGHDPMPPKQGRAR